MSCFVRELKKIIPFSSTKNVWSIKLVFVHWFVRIGYRFIIATVYCIAVNTFLMLSICLISFVRIEFSIERMNRVTLFLFQEDIEWPSKSAFVPYILIKNSEANMDVACYTLISLMPSSAVTCYVFYSSI
jgi:hypothetical protein